MPVPTAVLSPQSQDQVRFAASIGLASVAEPANVSALPSSPVAGPERVVTDGGVLEITTVMLVESAPPSLSVAVKVTV